MRLLRQLQIDESNIEGGGTGILIQVDGDPVPSTYYCYDFDQFRLYSRDRIQSVSDNAQASVQGAS